MCVFTDLATTLQTLLTTEAEQAARHSGCVRRQRKLSAALFVQTLVFGWMHDPHASLDRLADFAADLGVDLTPQAARSTLHSRRQSLSRRRAGHGVATCRRRQPRRHSPAATLPRRLRPRRDHCPPSGRLGQPLSRLRRPQSRRRPSLSQDPHRPGVDLRRPRPPFRCRPSARRERAAHPRASAAGCFASG